MPLKAGQSQLGRGAHGLPVLPSKLPLRQPSPLLLPGWPPARLFKLLLRQISGFSTILASILSGLHSVVYLVYDRYV
jgi:hypothetical protein